MSSSPTFRRPPLVEVALSAQFFRLENFEAIHFGLLWERFRETYPKFEHHGAIPYFLEPFDDRTRSQPIFQVEAVPRPPLPRIWFTDVESTHLVQIQNDRFVVNWRKIHDDDPYPSYLRLRERFNTEFLKFSAFVEEWHLGRLEMTQAEVTYVDHIVDDDGEAEIRRLDRFFVNWSGNRLSEPENAEFKIRYPIRMNKTADGEPVGRLHISVQPAVRSSDGAEVLSAQYVARGNPLRPGLDGVLRFFDLGHDAIIARFIELTTAEAQQLWGRVE